MRTASAVEIRTPEGVTFSLTVDGAVTTAAVIAIGYVAQPLVPLLGDYASAAVVLLYFVVTIGYGIALEWLWKGRTLGKRVGGCVWRTRATGITNPDRIESDQEDPVHSDYIEERNGRSYAAGTRISLVSVVCAFARGEPRK